MLFYAGYFALAQVFCVPSGVFTCANAKRRVVMVQRQQKGHDMENLKPTAADLRRYHEEWLVKASHVHGCALASVGGGGSALPLLLRAAAMDAKENGWTDRLALIEAVILAFQECKASHSDRDEAGRAADELSAASAVFVGQLENIAAGLEP